MEAELTALANNITLLRNLVEDQGVRIPIVQVCLLAAELTFGPIALLHCS